MEEVKAFKYLWSTVTAKSEMKVEVTYKATCQGEEARMIYSVEVDICPSTPKPKCGRSL